jgi:hypothetical protein
MKIKVTHICEKHIEIWICIRMEHMLRKLQIGCLMSKLDEQNVQGGETAMLHLDDWEHCDDLYQ